MISSLWWLVPALWVAVMTVATVVSFCVAGEPPDGHERCPVHRRRSREETT